MLVIYLLSPFILFWRCLLIPVLPLWTRKWCQVVMFKYVEMWPFEIFRRGVQVLLKRSWHHHGSIQGCRSKGPAGFVGFLVSLFHWEAVALAWCKGWKAKHGRNSRVCRVVKYMDLNQTQFKFRLLFASYVSMHKLLNLSKDQFLHVQSRNRAIESLLGGGIMVDNTPYLI